jgi:hypothetical protein
VKARGYFLPRILSFPYLAAAVEVVEGVAAKYEYGIGKILDLGVVIGYNTTIK